jgi:hypothetical protein
MSDGNKPKLSKRGRPTLPPHQRKQHDTLFAVVSPEVGSRVRAEADRRGLSYSQLVGAFIDSGMAELAEQQAA